MTGGAGFIGSHLVESLVESGSPVRVLDDFSTGREENLAPIRDRIELLRGDLRDEGICRRAVEGVGLVFHQAALGSVPRSLARPERTLGVNVGGTGNLLAAAREAGVERFVYASSSSVYGDSSRLPKREGEEGAPLSPYALSKRMNEELADVFQRCYDLGTVGLRYFNVYGPRQDPAGPYAAVVPRFVERGLRGEAMTIHGDGEQSRDFTYVADAVRANLLAAEAGKEATNRVFNVAGGRRVTVNELARRIRELTKSGTPPRHGPARPGDVRHSLADLTEAERGLGYAPTVSLEEGLRRTVEAYRRGSST
ncbi:MAG: SDR family oxidoreductase, partial [Thermoanaerobaculia bacterium]|nr:SDR family oxidoreductase [Thermoanaerobaculia bacterium]